jgi:enoyl reductase
MADDEWAVEQGELCVHPVRNRLGAVLSTAIVLAGASFAASPSAVATITDDSQYQEDTSAGAHDQEITSQVRFDLSKNGSGKSSGTVTAVGNWTPPACWYEPKYTPEAKEQEYKDLLGSPLFSGKKEAVEGMEYRFKDGHPYTDFNKKKSGKGMFWTSARDDSRPTDPHIWDCDKADFWADNGDAPVVENAIDTETLAGLAYSRIQVPDTEVALAPEQTTKVNLPTWAWLDKADFHAVSVTASLSVAGWNLSATTTAKPVSLRLDPGTADATTYPANGECTINADGSIGEPYAKGKANETPPCGLAYLRSSNGGTYKLKATITWEITWHGSNGENGRFPDGTFGNDQDITVQEIQAINR